MRIRTLPTALAGAALLLSGGTVLAQIEGGEEAIAERTRSAAQGAGADQDGGHEGSRLRDKEWGLGE